MSDGLRPEDLIGSTLAGRYRILERLGEGGMATVYAAHHVTLDSKVAVKVLQPHLARDARQRKRFVREARSANRIVHEHVVRILDFAEDPTPYFVMEYLEGEDLAHRVHRCGRMPWPEVRTLALQILSALEAAHALGIVHRDIKPSNIFLTRRPDGRDFVKVLDFGVAKVEDGTPGTRGMTRTNEVLGTVLYMAPEQALGGAVDARSDLYSFGVVLHQLVTGEVPFTGTNPFQVIHQHLQKAPPPLPSDAPPGLDAIVARLLAKAPEQRYPTARAVADDLERIGVAAFEALPPSGTPTIGFVPGPMAFAPPPSGAFEGPSPPARASQWVFTGSSAGDLATDPGLGEAAPLYATMPGPPGATGAQPRTGKRTGGGIAAVAILAVVALIGGAGGFWAWRATSAEPSGATEGVESTAVVVSSPPSAGKKGASEGLASTQAGDAPVSPDGSDGSDGSPRVAGSPGATVGASDAASGPAPTAAGSSTPGAPTAPGSPTPAGSPSSPAADPPAPPTAPATAASPSTTAPETADAPPSSATKDTSRATKPAASRPAAPSARPPRATSRPPAASGDARVLQDLQRQLVAQCSRHDPGSLASIELEITRDGKAYPEIHNVNAAAKSCLRTTIRRQSFSPGKSRSHTLRVHLGS